VRPHISGQTRAQTRLHRPTPPQPQDPAHPRPPPHSLRRSAARRIAAACPAARRGHCLRLHKAVQDHDGFKGLQPGGAPDTEPSWQSMSSIMECPGRLTMPKCLLDELPQCWTDVGAAAPLRCETAVFRATSEYDIKICHRTSAQSRRRRLLLWRVCL